MPLCELPAATAEALRPSEHFFDIADHLEEGVYFIDLTRRILYWNKAAERITGYTAEEIVGRRCGDNLLVHTDLEGNPLCLAGCPSLKAMAEGLRIDSRLFCLHKKGHRLTIDMKIVPVFDAAGRPAGVFEIMSDRIGTESLRQEMERLAGVAATDFLTGLPNRRSMEEQIDVAFYSFHRHDHSFGMVLADIDHFKQFNDRYGHEVGDRVLKNVATSLRAALRLEDFGCRWGGEEFAVLARHLTQPEHLVAMMERIRRVVGWTHLPHESGSLAVTLSLGGTLVRSDDDRHSLLARTDAMLYKSKAAGRNRSQVG